MQKGMRLRQIMHSTRSQKAERLRAAQRLLADTGVAEAAAALSHAFGLSRRQAYRYLELARAGAPAPSTAKNSVAITFKMPESLARDLRAHATESGVTTSEVVRQAVAAFLAAKRPNG
jgi:predicted DNA-binding transcriptional regulator YafY